MLSLDDITGAYDAWSGELLSYILKSVSDRALAEDILQDVFLRLLEYSSRRPLDAGNLRALLYTIVRTVCIDAARKRRSERMDPVDPSNLESAPSPDAQRDEYLTEVIERMYVSLHEPDRTILFMRRAGFSYAEIASVVRASERTVKRKFAFILEKIQEMITDDDIISL